jgi:hypothetical protein
MPQLSKFSYPLIVLSEVPLKVPIPGMITGCTVTKDARKRTCKSVVCTAFQTDQKSTQLQPGAVWVRFGLDSDATVNCQTLSICLHYDNNHMVVKERARFR